jgi:transglutaminase-like putative cysteine protease
MKLRIVHKSTYHYGEPATTSHHEAHLTPRQSEVQRTITHDIDVTPAPTARRGRLDYFGNRTTYFGLTEPHRKLEVTATSLVETKLAYLPDFNSTPPWESVAHKLRTDLRRDVLQATQMRFASPLVPALNTTLDYAVPSFPKDRPILEGVFDLMHRIHSEFVYDPRATDLSTPLLEVFTLRRGVCQDFAHVMLACLRSLGLAARYTSGYLRTHPQPGQPRLIGADASHAWVTVWVPDQGWIDFDPTNDLVPGEEHVTVAFGRDFSDVTPLNGVILGGGKHQLDVSVDVEAMG